MSQPIHNPLMERIEGPAPVMEVMRDLLKRTALVAPIFIGVGALFWQTNGALSVAYGLAIVVVNFVMAATMLAYAGRISLALMGGAALFGFLMRLGLMFLAVIAVIDQPWVEVVPLGITLIVAHIGILFWEMRFISGTMAYPGVKPSKNLSIHEPAASSGAPAKSNEHTGAA